MGTLNNGYIKKINQELIINEIRNRGVISRVNLAELLHLSIPGVSKNVKQLVNRNILIEMGEGESIGGRRPKLYSLNSNYRFIVGVDFSSEVIRIALVNMDGNILELNNLSRTKKRINIQTIKKMKDKINEMLSRNKVLNNQISVIVMGMQGIVNEVTGEIVTFNWFEDMQRIDIRKILKDDFETEVIIKNDINLAAIGECHYGAGKELKELIMINVDTGLGSGIVIDRKIYAGSRFASGEIAAFITNINDIGQDDFSEFLEYKISIPSILDRIKDDVLKGETSKYWSNYANNTEKIDYNNFLLSFKNGDSYSKKIVDIIAKYLSWLIINMILILDIEVVVLGGEITRLGTPLKNLIQDYIATTMPSPSPLTIKIVFSELGERAGIYGSIVIGLEYLYEHLTDK